MSKIEENPFVSLHGDFSTVYKRKKFVKNSKNYIPPREVKLPPDNSGTKRTFQYIPVTDLVKAIAGDPGFKQELDFPKQREMLYDFKDGAFWKNNDFFRNNPEALAMIFYSDELEVCNPLGAARGRQKVLNLYMSLAEISKPLRKFSLEDHCRLLHFEVLQASMKAMYKIFYKR